MLSQPLFGHASSAVLLGPGRMSNDFARNVKELLMHENGDYTIEAGGQAVIFMPSLLWSRNLIWQINFRGSDPAVVRPRVERRRESNTRRKGSIPRPEKVPHGLRRMDLHGVVCRRKVGKVSQRRVVKEIRYGGGLRSLSFAGKAEPKLVRRASCFSTGRAKTCFRTIRPRSR